MVLIFFYQMLRRDKFICSYSGFYDLLERDDEIMADRGFKTKEELMLNYCSLSVPSRC